MENEEFDTWTRIEKSEMIDTGQVLINLIKASEDYLMSRGQNELLQFEHEIKEAIGVYSGAEKIYQILLNSTALAMSSDFWEDKERTEIVHLVRHCIDLLNAAECYAREAKLVNFFWEERV